MWSMLLQWSDSDCALTVTSPTFLSGRCSTISSNVRPGYRWASNDACQSGLNDAFLRTYLVSLPAQYMPLRTIPHVFPLLPAPAAVSPTTKVHNGEGHAVLFRLRSAVFAVVRCLSVRLSVKLVYCIHMAEDIIKLLSRPGSRIILVFWFSAPVPNSKGNPFSGGAKYTGVGKFCDYRKKSPFISEKVRARPLVAMER